jgi:low temperature requirement protein LtrA
VDLLRQLPPAGAAQVETGHSILYSHLFLLIGLAILASLIRHAILGSLDPRDFRQLAVAGTVLFFLGKQYGYYKEVPELRPYLLSNTAAVFALTALVLMLPLGLEAMLVGLTATMICYVLLNLRYRHLVRITACGASAMSPGRRCAATAPWRRQ